MTLRSGTTEFSIARDGTLIYMPADASPSRTLVWVDRQGREQPVKGAPARAYTYPRLSPDGAHLALNIRDQENVIWVWDFARESLRRVTFDPGPDESPVWMPDGRRIVFGFQAAANASGNRLPALFWRPSDGTGTAERLGQEEPSLRSMLPSSVSPDGTRIVTWSVSDSAAVDVMMLTLSGSPPSTADSDALRREEWRNLTRWPLVGVRVQCVGPVSDLRAPVSRREWWTVAGLERGRNPGRCGRATAKSFCMSRRIAR